MEQTSNTEGTQPVRHPYAPWRSFFAGSCGAMTEVSINQPLFTLGNQLITKGKCDFRASKLYCGFRANLGSMIPSTGLQIAGDNRIREMISENGELTLGQRMGAACGGGALAAFVAGPTERYMVARQHDLTLKMQSPRWWAAGLPAAAARDSKFTVGYRVVAPEASERFRTWFETVGMQPAPAREMGSISGGITAGVGAAFVSQPHHVIKTRQQALDRPVSYWVTLKSVWREEGITGLWKGGGPRAARVGSAVLIFSKVCPWAEEQYDSHTKA